MSSSPLKMNVFRLAKRCPFHVDPGFCLYGTGPYHPLILKEKEHNYDFHNTVMVVFHFILSKLRNFRIKNINLGESTSLTSFLFSRRDESYA